MADYSGGVTEPEKYANDGLQTQLSTSPAVDLVRQGFSWLARGGKGLRLTWTPITGHTFPLLVVSCGLIAVFVLTSNGTSRYLDITIVHLAPITSSETDRAKHIITGTQQTTAHLQNPVLPSQDAIRSSSGPVSEPLTLAAAFHVPIA
jgi:hypothetical protein